MNFPNGPDAPDADLFPADDPAVSRAWAVIGCILTATIASGIYRFGVCAGWWA